MKKLSLALVALTLALLLVPCASLASTATKAAPKLEVGDKVPTVPKHHWNRDCMGVKATAGWISQARVGGFRVNLRLYDGNDELVLFEEDLARLSMSNQELRLTLHAQTGGDDLTMQIGQYALDILAGLQITQIVVASEDYTAVMVVSTEDIQLLRDGLSLADGDLLCLGGEEVPINVISEDGIRRLVN